MSAPAEATAVHPFRIEVPAEQLLEVVGPLTDATAHGGHAEDAFDLVLPSLPGFGFSAEPESLGWDPGRVAQGWATLMNRLDNITLYWLTNTATSAARIYWEGARATAAATAAGRTPPEVALPVAFTVFPGEISRAPRTWAERVYPNLAHFNEVDRGGHFAA
jgi:hypothetical protein